MYHTTGLTKAGFADLCGRIENIKLSPGMRRWPPVLGLRDSLKVTLTYLRKNRVQAEIAEDFGVSQPTVSRAISAVTPLLVIALSGFAPAVRMPDDGGSYFVDGTLLPSWIRRDHPELWSGKHRRAGMKVLIACTPAGRPAWISAPVNGKHHDMYLWNQLGLSAGSDPFAFCGDTAFTGSGMTVPLKKPRKAEFEPWEKEYNKSIAQVRWIVEQAIANFKTWRIIHTGHRRPVETFPETIAAVTALHFYTNA
jgi:DDE superfamily endonuclease/Helix-turn-helix of DDE superfamily endonuclease